MYFLGLGEGLINCGQVSFLNRGIFSSEMLVINIYIEIIEVNKNCFK